MPIRPHDLARLPTPLVPLDEPFLSEHGVEVWLKLEGASNPELGGNKVRKLVPNFELALQQGADTIVAFGIPKSSLLYAAAGGARQLGLRSVAITFEGPGSRRALERLQAQGMEVFPISTAQYREAAPDARVDLLAIDEPNAYVLPEGGSNPVGVTACKTIVDEIDIDVDVFVAPVGSGGLFAGIASGAAGRARAVGVTAFIDEHYDHRRIAKMIADASGGQPLDNWELVADHADDGGTPPASMRAFMREFHARHGVELDTRYNGRAMFALWERIASGSIARGQRIVVVNTGGLETGEHRLRSESEISRRRSLPTRVRRRVRRALHR